MKGIFFGVGIAALCATVFGAVNHVIVKELMKIAIDRKESKLFSIGKNRIMHSDDLTAIMEKLNCASEDLCRANCKEVCIKSHDGIKLTGHWRECKNAKRIIIAMHGWRSTWSQDFGAIADFWNENGCSVLYVEQRAHGKSDGEYMSFGLLERYDCLDWVKWVNCITDNSLPIYLAGISMGATTVLMSAGFELPKNVCGIIADCAFTSPEEIWRHVVKHNLHLPYGLYNKSAFNICKRKTSVGSKDYSCIDAMEKCNVPVLFIHGTSDHFVPIEMTYKNYQACNAKKHLLIVPGAEHGMSYLVDKNRYENTVKMFWDEYDKEIVWDEQKKLSV